MAQPSLWISEVQAPFSMVRNATERGISSSRRRADPRSKYRMPSTVPTAPGTPAATAGGERLLCYPAAKDDEPATEVRLFLPDLRRGPFGD